MMPPSTYTAPPAVTTDDTCPAVATEIAFAST